jgi:hypothetical protein
VQNSLSYLQVQDSSLQTVGVTPHSTRIISSPHGKSFLGVTSCDGFSLGADAPANRKSRSGDYPMIACFAALPA